MTNFCNTIIQIIIPLRDTNLIHRHYSEFSFSPNTFFCICHFPNFNFFIIFIHLYPQNYFHLHHGNIHKSLIYFPRPQLHLIMFRPVVRDRLKCVKIMKKKLVEYCSLKKDVVNEIAAQLTIRIYCLIKECCIIVFAKLSCSNIK